MYDLTVPGPEAFVANGLVVHNCRHKDPDYPGCTQFGKTRGPPYSGPLSDGRIRSRALVFLERWEEW